MVELTDLDHPTPDIRSMLWDEKKIDKLVDRLMTAHLMTADGKRDRDYLKQAWFDYFSQKDGTNIPYEFGDMDVVGMFVNIVPGESSFLLLKIVNTDSFGKKFVRQGRIVVKKIMDAFDLKFIETNTADERVLKLVKLFGFKEAGVKKDGFVYFGKPYDLHRLVYQGE